MAPFLQHLVVGERVWSALNGQQPGEGLYGTFLFGCLAPDVDKFCEYLEQGTTHFVSKDETGTYAWRRSQTFLQHQAKYLRAPFCALDAVEQAFVMGYLCHIATDEISGRMGQTIRGQLSAARQPLPNVDAILTVVDPRSWHLAAEPGTLVTALATAIIPGGTFIFVPPDCLTAMHRIVLPQVREGGGLESFVRMKRRQWQWLRHGRVSDATDDPELETELADYRRYIEIDMEAAERLTGMIELEVFARDAVSHSLQRLRELLASEDEQ